MKNFKEFLKCFNEGMTNTATDMSFVYATYCQGFAEGKEEAFKVMLSVFSGNDWQSDKAIIDDKMKVYPEQLKKEYSSEELKEIQKAVNDMNKYLAEHTEK